MASVKVEGAGNGDGNAQMQPPLAVSSIKTRSASPDDIKSSIRKPASSWLLPEGEDEDDDEMAAVSDTYDAVDQDQKRSGSSRAESPAASQSPIAKNRRRKTAAADGPTQTAAHLPQAGDEARKTFAELKGNLYQNNKIGRSRGYKDEAMECECRHPRGGDPDEILCGEDSECINRLTQVECKGSDCSCGPRCANQRFQRREFADVEIVQTEKKGFGLRAGSPITADQFVYEYIGEVVEQQEFMKRMQQYRDEHIRHFYFMMLQREEFLDATRKGGIARFINHSCSPNCYVSKWHVGKHMRMGIFAKRDIIKGEELTFNYNVDRYGNDAQPCYCGEPNCVGSIGGKTQTDIGGMDQLFIDALGISDEVDRLDARGTRKKKSMLLDEDFNPTLRPLDDNDDVAKIMTAVRQAASNRSILQKLLLRIHMTQDAAVQRSLVRLHGFILISSILDEWRDDKEIVVLSMGSLARWPLVARNKVVDSGVDKQVQEFADVEDTNISSLASELLAAWDALEMSYRIARKDAREGNSSSIFAQEHRRSDDALYETSQSALNDARAPNAVSAHLDSIAPRPLGITQLANPNGTPGRARDDEPYRERRPAPRRSQPAPPAPLKQPVVPAMSIEEIIKKAHEAEAEQRRKAEEDATAKAAAALVAEEKANRAREAFLSGTSRKRSSRPHDSSSSDKKQRTEGKQSASDHLEDAARRLKKLIGEVVVRCMSSYKADLDRDAFKKHAKDLTTIICDKEKKNPKMWPPRDAKSKYLPDGLSKDKRDKVQSFANDYVSKLVAHRRSKQLQAGTNGKSGSQDGAFSGTPASGASHTSGTPRDGRRHDDDDLDLDSRSQDEEDDDDQEEPHLAPLDHSGMSSNGAADKIPPFASLATTRDLSDPTPQTAQNGHA